jgi:uncharacterized protein
MRLFPFLLLLAIAAPAQVVTNVSVIPVTENPSAVLSRTYHVLAGHPDTLYGEFTETYNNVEITKGYYRNNQPDGKWIFHFQNRKTEREMTFTNGVLEGPYVQYYPSGDTMLFCTYKNGKQDGEVRTFYDKRKPKALAFMIDGQKMGTTISWYENGAVKEEIHHVNGKRDGEYKSYYDTGKLSKEAVYVDGRLHGISKEYYSSGALRLEIEYRNGLEWNLVSHGNMTKEAGALVNGTGTFTIFDNDRKQLYDRRLKDGLQEGLQSIYESGKLKETSEYHLDMRNGKRTVYVSASGLVYSEQNYVNDTLHGHSVFYYFDKPAKSSEGDFSHGEEVKETWKYYAPDGKEIPTPMWKEESKVINGRIFPDGVKDSTTGREALFPRSLLRFPEGARNFLCICSRM